MSITTDTPAQVEINPAAAQVAITATADTQVATIQLVERAAKAAFAALQEANIAAGNACAVAVLRAMAAGDAAIALEPFAPARGKQSFLKKKTGAPLSTIKLCMMLAQGRTRIEAEMANAVSQMTIRKARNLLSPPRATPKKPELLIAWQRATDDERKALFAAVDFDEARLAFSTEYFKKLEQRCLDQQARIETSGKVTIDLNNPPSVIETARKAIRQALPRDRSDGERLNALNKADAIRCRGGFTYDDILPVRDPANAGTKLVRSARRRAA